jgi:hypothetical protein
MDKYQANDYRATVAKIEDNIFAEIQPSDEGIKTKMEQYEYYKEI